MTHRVPNKPNAAWPSVLRLSPKRQDVVADSSLGHKSAVAPWGSRPFPPQFTPTCSATYYFYYRPRLQDRMGHAPSSSRGSTPPPELPQPPLVPSRAHTTPPREALALMRGQSLNAMAQPAAAVSLASFPLPAPKLVAATKREVLPEEDVGDAMPGGLEETCEEESNLRTGWAGRRTSSRGMCDRLGSQPCRRGREGD